MSKNGERIIAGLGEVLATFQRAEVLMSQGVEQNAAIRQAARELGSRVYDPNDGDTRPQQEKP